MTPSSAEREPIYPDLEVDSNEQPLVLVSSVRYALWRAGVSPERIADFTREALSAPARRQRRICSHWVRVQS